MAGRWEVKERGQSRKLQEQPSSTKHSKQVVWSGQVLVGGRLPKLPAPSEQNKEAVK
jgi:hypothetical protein